MSRFIYPGTIEWRKFWRGTTWPARVRQALAKKRVPLEINRIQSPVGARLSFAQIASAAKPRAKKQPRRGSRSRRS